MEKLIEQVSQDRDRPQPIKCPLPVNELYKRPTYVELIDFIETDPYEIKYPDRAAKFTGNSFQLSFLDKFNTETLHTQQENLLKYQIAKAEIAKRAVEHGTSVATEAIQFQTPNSKGSNDTSSNSPIA